MCGHRLSVALAALALTAAACGGGSPTAPSSTSGSQPFLTKTKFLAFGDSLTLGFISDAPLSAITFKQPIVGSHIPPDPTTSYPFLLNGLLSMRYPGQTISVVNDGSGGEFITDGLRRLPGLHDTRRPEVLLLLEGINGITSKPAVITASELEQLVQVALIKQVDVLIATLTPVSDTRELEFPGEQAAIRETNRLIAGMAERLGIEPAVDLFTAFANDPTLLSSDGKHPSAAGYRKMAETFADAIINRFETVAASTWSS